MEPKFGLDLPLGIQDLEDPSTLLELDYHSLPKENLEPTLDSIKLPELGFDPDLDPKS